MYEAFNIGNKISFREAEHNIMEISAKLGYTVSTKNSKYKSFWINQHNEKVPTDYDEGKYNKPFFLIYMSD